ncbi:MAG: TlpA family protein disulfide reductase [Pseudomonadota bacterium]|nr:TlpA family protein disulfide reductase [Pseudomonadota bacterium]
MDQHSTPTFARRRAFVAGSIAGAVALAAGVYVGTAQHEPATLTTEALFGLSLPDAQGHEQKLSQWRGKVMVVNFWATWCAPCREEMPQFVKVQSELGGRGLQFVGIAADDASKVRAFAEELGLNYPALIGGFGAIELSKGFGNRLMALPFTIVVDRAGTVAHTQLGPLTAAKLHSVVQKLL